MKIEPGDLVLVIDQPDYVDGLVGQFRTAVNSSIDDRGWRCWTLDRDIQGTIVKHGISSSGTVGVPGMVVDCNDVPEQYLQPIKGVRAGNFEPCVIEQALEAVS